jgi:hypothetical protein
VKSLEAIAVKGLRRTLEKEASESNYESCFRRWQGWKGKMGVRANG